MGDEAPRIIVCGSRSWHSLVPILQRLAKLPENTVVVHGNAQGADQLAASVANDLGLETRPYPAAWKVHQDDGFCQPRCSGRKTCYGAGHRRNQQMMDSERPSLVIAFWHANSPGTRDMVARATAAGVPVEVISE